ncbi:MAG TPA: CRTAC1 family protein [Verrucomicrobiales bacterium]|nr:CRTAC1 family protein [Verrucomicrobiales bacterium]
MLSLLADIRDRTPDENSYLGDAQARNLREQLHTLPATAPPVERWRIQRLLGVAELKLGNEEEGIALLEEARKLLPQVESIIGPKYAQDTHFQLAVGYMRYGETQNCCALHTPDSCIVPIQGGGIHTRREGSQSAIEALHKISPADQQQYFASVWLLNIAAMTLGEYPHGIPESVRIPEKFFHPETDFPRFPNISGNVGLDTFSLAGAAVVDDFDNNGYLDIFTTTWDSAGEPKLFLNDGAGAFRECGPDAGLTGLFGGLNAVQADFDNDGWLDLFILRGAWLGPNGGHPNSLLRNNGPTGPGGTISFTDVTFAAGLGEAHYPTQTAGWADYDLDGDLDLFIGNETTMAFRAPCQLFRNNGDGTFTDVAPTAGVENFAFTKGVTWGDYDGDRYPDLYISNLEGPNRLYRNNGDGTFTDLAAALNVQRPINSFPVWFWDFDNDGHLDLFVSSYDGEIYNHAAFHLGRPAQMEFAALYRNNGKGGFDNVAAQAGLEVPMLPMGANFGDLNADGFPDFYLGTGDPSFDSLLPNQMWLNREGERFEDVTMTGGFGHIQKGHAIAFADLDHDGDEDVFEQLGGAYLGDRYRDALFENPGFGNRWIALRLEGSRSNRSAIGAQIRVEVQEPNGARRVMTRRVNSGGSFGSNPLRQTIGLGKAERITQVEIFWPASGIRQQLEQVPFDRILAVAEGVEGFRLLEAPAFTFPDA